MTNTTTRGLGRGLSALISENYNQNQSNNTNPQSANPPTNNTSSQTIQNTTKPISGINNLPINSLIQGKYQPRTKFAEQALNELSESIKRNGIMQPIIVRPNGNNGYEIIAGERRWRAAKQAGLSEVPALVRDINDKQALELALVENVQRQDLLPLEEAIGYQRLIEEFDYTQEELSNIVGKSRSHVTNLLRLLSLPDEIKDMLDNGELTMGHARTLIGIPNSIAIAKEIVAKGMSVRQAEDITRQVQGHTKRKNSRSRGNSYGNTSYDNPQSQEVRRDAPINKDPDIIALEETLSENLGIRVSIHDKGQTGEIILSYDSLSQLDEILRRLGDGI
ncbi:MAG: ParB/RepB/Spo0J family partition protein [Rickettsiales bacterium]